MSLDSYIGDLTGISSLMIDESRKIAALLQKVPTIQEWNDAIEQQNILQKSSMQTARRQARCIAYRLKPLPNKYLKVIENGNSKEAEQLLFFALLHHSSLVMDFFKLAVIEPQNIFKTEMPKSIWEDFLGQYHTTVTHLADSTLMKIKKNILSSLVDVGYINDRKNRQYLNVFVEPVIYEISHEMNRLDILRVMERKG